MGACLDSFEADYTRDYMAVTQSCNRLPHVASVDRLDRLGLPDGQSSSETVPVVSSVGSCFHRL